MRKRSTISVAAGNPESRGRTMPRRAKNRLSAAAERFAAAITAYAGSTTAFVLALATIAAWGATGPLFGYSDTWQLVINTGTTIVTFLMVFLIQRTQNKDALAIQLKLNEVVAALQGASNRLISVEDLTEDELHTLYLHYQRLAEMAKDESKIGESHSVEEARARHERKRGVPTPPAA
jgi:low affinity Fe/Cu permease